MTSAVTTDEGTRLQVTFAIGTSAMFDRFWLRDSCPCGECLHPSRQRLVSVTQLPGEPRLASAHADDGAVEVEVEFAPDGHRSRFQVAWLQAQLTPPARRVETWDATLAVAEAAYGDVAEPGPALRDWLAGADRVGLAVLHGVPNTDGAVADVAELFGHVRATNYGRVFEVRSVVDPSNVADTALALGPHTDNPYRVPVPSLQLLHCLQSSSSGGESTFVDGLRVAAELRREDPAAFELLASVPV